MIERTSPVQAYINATPTDRDPLEIQTHIGDMETLMGELLHDKTRIPEIVWVHLYNEVECLLDDLDQLQELMELWEEEGLPQVAPSWLNLPGGGRMLDLDEEDLLKLVATGMTDREIAEVYQCSAKTITRRRLQLGQVNRAQTAAHRGVTSAFLESGESGPHHHYLHQGWL